MGPHSGHPLPRHKKRQNTKETKENNKNTKETTKTQKENTKTQKEKTFFLPLKNTKHFFFRKKQETRHKSSGARLFGQSFSVFSTIDGERRNARGVVFRLRRGRSDLPYLTLLTPCLPHADPCLPHAFRSSARFPYRPLGGFSRRSSIGSSTTNEEATRQGFRLFRLFRRFRRFRLLRLLRLFPRFPRSASARASKRRLGRLGRIGHRRGDR